jgi:hypothetical protein
VVQDDIGEEGTEDPMRQCGDQVVRLGVKMAWTWFTLAHEDMAWAWLLHGWRFEDDIICFERDHGFKNPSISTRHWSRALGASSGLCATSSLTEDTTRLVEDVQEQF